MGKPLKKDVHQTSADTATPVSTKHADADQLEVSPQPSLGGVRLQHLERVVGPPLAMLTRVAVGEADQRVGVVGASEAKAAPTPVPVPNSTAPGLVVGVVTEDGLVHGPHHCTVLGRGRIVDTESHHAALLPDETACYHTRAMPRRGKALTCREAARASKSHLTRCRDGDARLG